MFEVGQPILIRSPLHEQLDIVDAVTETEIHARYAPATFDRTTLIVICDWGDPMNGTHVLPATEEDCRGRLFEALLDYIAIRAKQTKLERLILP